MNGSKWDLYNALIEGIPEDIVVEDFMIGSVWSSVKAGGNTGVALTVRERAREAVYRGQIIGDRLRDVAGSVMSWNFVEASLGLAAINCFYNTALKVSALGGFNGLDTSAAKLENNTERDAFSELTKEALGKSVAVIGRFPHLERQLEPICRLSVLERSPEPGDYPDSACEYILPEQEMIFITGMTLTNKTLPRLLQLAANSARVVLVGPSVPMTPILYRFGVTDLYGFCVTNHEKTERLVKLGDHRSIFAGGAMVGISRPTSP